MPKIILIEDLKNISEISEMCHVAEEPIYITKNGYGDMVVMSIEMYENMMKKLNMYNELALCLRHRLKRVKLKMQGNLLEICEISMYYRIIITKNIERHMDNILNYLCSTLDNWQAARGLLGCECI